MPPPGTTLLLYSFQNLNRNTLLSWSSHKVHSVLIKALTSCPSVDEIGSVKTQPWPQSAPRMRFLKFFTFCGPEVLVGSTSLSSHTPKPSQSQSRMDPNFLKCTLNIFTPSARLGLSSRELDCKVVWTGFLACRSQALPSGGKVFVCFFWMQF